MKNLKEIIFDLIEEKMSNVKNLSCSKGKNFLNFFPVNSLGNAVSVNFSERSRQRYYTVSVHENDEYVFIVCRRAISLLEIGPKTGEEVCVGSSGVSFEISINKEEIGNPINYVLSKDDGFSNILDLIQGDITNFHYNVFFPLHVRNKDIGEKI